MNPGSFGMDQGAISSAISGPGEFAHKLLGKFYRQTVTRLLSFASCASRVPALAMPVPVAATSREGWGIIWDLFPGINSPGQASVEHAPGYSGARTRHQWRCGAAGGGWCSSPWPRLTLPENPGKFSSSTQNPGNDLRGFLGNSRNFASSDGIVRGCTNQDPRRGGISVR